MGALRTFLFGPSHKDVSLAAKQMADAIVRGGKLAALKHYHRHAESDGQIVSFSERYDTDEAYAKAEWKQHLTVEQLAALENFAKLYL